MATNPLPANDLIARADVLATLRKQAAHHASRARIARRGGMPTLVSAHRHRIGALMEAREALKSLWSISLFTKRVQQEAR